LNSSTVFHGCAGRVVGWPRQTEIAPISKGTTHNALGIIRFIRPDAVEDIAVDGREGPLIVARRQMACSRMRMGISLAACGRGNNA